MYNIHSLFQGKFKTNGVWKTERRIFYGDLSSVDTSTDYRFKEIEDKRTEFKFIRIVHIDTEQRPDNGD